MHLAAPQKRRAPDSVADSPEDVVDSESAEVAADRVQERIVVQRGDTLMDILLRAGIARAEAHEAVASLRTVYDPRRLRVGQFLNIELERAADAGPKLSNLSLNLNFENDLLVARAPAGGFDVRTSERDLSRERIAAGGIIEDSLYMAGERAGVPDEAIMGLIHLFSWDVDFQHDVQSGDSFQLVYDMLTTAEGDQSRVDALQYVRLDLRGRTLEAFRLEREDGTADYYDRDGNSLRKWLMRTPIDGARLSSGFGQRRHPVLGYTKMHKGVDFAAPRGTPIYAAGDGTVMFAGRKGTYGNYIQIRHNGEYATAYAHLKGFASGVRKGRRVSQGEIIGYVGTTGRSTGPHLHYEVLDHGRQINPMSVKRQIVTKLAGLELARFQTRVAETMARLDSVSAQLQLAQSDRR